MNKSQKFRVRLILIGIILIAFTLVTALYATQIVNGASYVAKADKQYARPTNTVFDRGNIYFSAKDNTEITAATVERGYLVFMNPKEIKDAEQTFDALSAVITISHDAFMKAASRKNDPYEKIIDKVDTVQAQSVAGLKLAGIGVSSEAWRSYPGGQLAAHTLGLVGENASSTLVEGKYGLERYYESTLTRVGSANNSSDIFAQLFAGLRESVFGANTNRGNVVTTIEPTVSAYLDKILGETTAIWHPDVIGGIIIDPTNGDIVAMSSLPSYDPNDTSKVNDVRIFSNPLVENVYEMGSIMKPLTMAMGLDSGAIKSSTTYDDTGCLILDKKKICNFDGRARGKTDMQQILSQSLNVGAATIALTAGSTTLEKYFDSFGLAEKTGIDLPNEANGLTSNLKEGRDIDIATAAYGQGIAISPIAITRALSILANGGNLIRPHILKEIDLDDGSVQKYDVGKKIPVISKSTVDGVVGMLINVVDKAFRKGAISMNNYSIAAKTGTAQIPDHTNGGYYKDRYLHSFFGFFPAYNPKFLIFLYQVYPKGAMYASETLTAPFDSLTKFLINYYNIPPDR